MSSNCERIDEQRAMDMEDAECRLAALQRALAARDDARAAVGLAAAALRKAKRNLVTAEQHFADLLCRLRRRGN